MPANPSSVQKYMKKVRKRSSQNWATFLKNHSHEIWACDFTTIQGIKQRIPARLNQPRLQFPTKSKTR
jgi:hypothetical protein